MLTGCVITDYCQRPLLAQYPPPRDVEGCLKRAVVGGGGRRRLHDQGTSDRRRSSASSSSSSRHWDAEAGWGGGGLVEGGGGEYVQPYHIKFSSDISDCIHELYSIHPHILNLTSAQELYGLPTTSFSDKDFSHDHVDGRNKARGGGLGSGWKRQRFCEGGVQELDINYRG